MTVTAARINAHPPFFHKQGLEMGAALLRGTPVGRGGNFSRNDAVGERCVP